jgi:hypothetical protein
MTFSFEVYHHDDHWHDHDALLARPASLSPGRGRHWQCCQPEWQPQASLNRRPRPGPPSQPEAAGRRAGAVTVTASTST